MAIRIPEDMSLAEDEIPIWFGQMSWISNWFWILIAIIFLFLGAFGIFIAIIILILVVISVLTSEYFISSKRIYIKRGLISRTLNDIKIEWITNIYVQQGIFGRILNYGNVGISSPGESAGAIGFMGVSDPIGIKKIIEENLIKNKKTP
jgi:uncharacterized membrane protein YdbT with pleckstrin-like domain